MRRRLSIALSLATIVLSHWQCRLVAVAAPPQAVKSRDAQVVATFVLPDVRLSKIQNDALPGSLANDRRIMLGGFSDLWRDQDDPPGVFWTVTDRGPNGEAKVDGQKRRTFPVPDFTPLLLRIEAQDDSLQVLETIPIVGQSGVPVSGLPNLAELDDGGFDFQGEESVEPNVNGLDVEGLVRTPTGEFWVAEEYRPSLVRIDSTGRVRKRFVPADQDLPQADCEVVANLPSVYARRQDNRGFEGLALSPDGRTLYAPMQSPLANPSRKVGRRSRNCRILAFDIESERPVAEYVYRFDAATEFASDAEPSAMKIGAMAMTSQNEMLVLERTDGEAKVYAVELDGASDILPTPWHDSTGSDSLEALADPATADVRVLPKRLVVDLSKLQHVPDKIEGLAVVDAWHIALVNDNDFGFKRFDARGNAVDNGVRSMLVLVKLGEPLMLSN